MRVVFRVLLALASLGIMAWRIITMKGLLAAVASTTSVAPVPYNDAVQKAIELLIDRSNSWAQVTTVLLGVLGALWIAKGDEPGLAFRRRLWPEIVMWAAGVFMLIAGLYCHNEYVQSISTALEAGGTTSEKLIEIPNVFDQKYQSLLSEQLWLLIYGAFASILAVLSVRNSSGGDNAHS